MIVEYIDDHKDQFGVEPICRELQVAPSTYYAAKARPASARSVGDAVLSEVIAAEHAANYGVYGARKMWKHLHRLGHPVGRCRVERLMRAADPHGAVRGRAKRTTIPGKDGTRAGDLVNRAFTATAPNQLWVADFTYVRTWAGFTYVAFIIDVFSRMIVGWKADTTMRADLVTDTLEMAVWSRGRAGVTDLQGLIHHTDAGSQYVSLALTERLAALGMRASIGTVGDAYDNALAESTIGLFKTELIRRRGPWRTLDDVEIATLEWVDWFKQPAPAHRARRHPTRRARDQPLPSDHSVDDPGNQRTEPPLNPGRFNPVKVGVPSVGFPAHRRARGAPPCWDVLRVPLVLGDDEQIHREHSFRRRRVLCPPAESEHHPLRLVR